MDEPSEKARPARALAGLYGLQLAFVVGVALLDRNRQADVVCELLGAPILWGSARLAWEGQRGAALAAAAVFTPLWVCIGLGLVGVGPCATHFIALVSLFCWIPGLDVLLALGAALLAWTDRPRAGAQGREGA